MSTFWDWLWGTPETQVASTSYNLAGDVENRADYLQMITLQNVLGERKASISEDLTKGYLYGPGMNFRSFFRWANNNFTTIGMPTGDMASSSALDMNIIASHIPHGSGETVWAQDGDTGIADYSRWVEQWFLENYPDQLNTAWTADIDPITNMITVVLADTSIHTFMPIDFDVNARYIYAYYTLATEDEPIPGTIEYEWSELYLFIYRIGSGITELDDTVQLVENYGEFFPFIPIRLESEFLSTTNLPDAYALTKKAYKKLTGSRIEKLVSQLEENANIDDIDFAYVVLGVSLNTKENTEIEYLYRFFNKLKESQIGGASEYEDWLNGRDDAEAVNEVFMEWLAAQDDPLNPLYGTPPPPTTGAPTPTFATNEIVIKNNGTLTTEYNQVIKWVYIAEQTEIGVGKPEAKIGDYWVEYIDSDEILSNIIIGSDNHISGKAYIDKIRIYNQFADFSYTYLEIVGLTHYNFVYNGKSVVISSKEALEDTKESGFIVPLHYETFIEMSIVDYSQMALNCVHIVFNSYEIVTIPWYQTGFFQVIVVVVIAVVSVTFTGGTGLGLLGTNLAIGSAIGLTGITAVIVGSVANALAAMILSAILTKLSVSIFGEEIGAIVAVIAGFLINQGINNFHQTGSFAVNWADLMRTENLMLALDAVGQGYSAFASMEIRDLAAQTTDLIDQAEDDLDRIRKEYYDQFGYGNYVIDPLSLTNNTRITFENGDTFLTRTLMTGSDIAEMSIDMLSDFTELTLKLPNPYS